VDKLKCKTSLTIATITRSRQLFLLSMAS